ncbi:MAG: hypothetical protein MR662_04315 [Treponema porcinum]|uniref:hypothetical protein n=1 Tax=Treponema porcinum TaxID=261392 RepID=UPI002353FC23|nr:hypothetical protein [Treponema porcinum]MCI6179696.1 hypothetical protein [Treponema porcinum]MCI6721922.1 hypothetical protein [Treponema porcinum]MCI6816425.1 hypothetical protein [Treponema porcinum]MCI7079627.1 hypothetical protein [Treponema porcinum]MCI7115749.1 hypothetical protein [Treponema porcinum]
MKFHLNRSGSLALKIVVRISLLVVLTCSTLTAVVLYFYRTSQEQQVTKSMERSGRDAGKLVDMKIASLISPEMQQLRFKLTGAMPSINTNVNSQYIAGFLKQLEYAFPMPSVPEMGQYWTVMNSASARIWDGASVEQELGRADMQISR